MFDGNDKIRGMGEEFSYTEEQIKELIRCREDILYFAEKYFYIKTVDKGEILIPLFEYQKRILKAYVDPPKRHIILMMPRQYSKTTCTSVFMTHFMLFNADKNIAVLANKEKTAIEIVERMQYAYERLPLWMQQGVREWNKKSLWLENGSKVMAAGTSRSAISGQTVALLYVDEFAKIPPGIAQDFQDSVFPTIYSSETGRIIITSTPKGAANSFYFMWKRAVEDEDNEFFPIRVHWDERPGRDQTFKQSIIRSFSTVHWKQEYACQFLGSANTLIDGEMLERMRSENPKAFMMRDAFLIYEYPVPGVTYILGVDTAKGTGKNFSVTQVLRYESKTKVKQVAIFRDNKISTNDYSQAIIEISKFYNGAYIMLENNAEGAAVGDAIWYHHEYDKIINVDPRGIGIRADRDSKLKANLLLRDYVHNGWLEICDANTISELNRYEEQDGKFNVFSGGKDGLDDCVTSLIWAIYFFNTPFFDGVDDSGGPFIKERFRLTDTQTYDTPVAFHDTSLGLFDPNDVQGEVFGKNQRRPR